MALSFFIPIYYILLENGAKYAKNMLENGAELVKNMLENGALDGKMILRR